MAAGEVQYVVLDEADKMLSQGLQPQLKRVRQLVLPKGRKQREPDPEGSPGALLRIPARARPQVTGLPSLCGHAPVPCVKAGHSSFGDIYSDSTLRRLQVLLFSATMPQSLAAMTAKWLRHPELVKLSEADTAISRSVVQVSGPSCTVCHFLPLVS